MPEKCLMCELECLVNKFLIFACKFVGFFHKMSIKTALYECQTLIRKQKVENLKKDKSETRKFLEDLKKTTRETDAACHSVINLLPFFCNQLLLSKNNVFTGKWSRILLRDVQRICDKI